MPEGININIRNKLITEKRDLNIYRHSGRSAYIISHGNSVNISFGTSEDEDYLHLSIVSGPGNMKKDCLINIPSWCDYSVTSLGSGEVTHSRDRTLIKIPPGPPVWQLKISRSIDQPQLPPPEDYISLTNSE